MGTNYYLFTNYCGHCNRGNQEHLGKSSAGWTFTFQALENVRSFVQWQAHINEEWEKGGKIRDEYGTEFTPEQLFIIVEQKRDAPHNHAREYPHGSWLDEKGNSFSESDFS